jgi:16S rRNA (guanine527-N7)-methyltransferase
VKPPLTPQDFARSVGIDDATVARLAVHLDLLARWQRRINLVGADTLADPWRRHVLDSAQLAPLLPAGTRSVADLGSGAGFPGLVLAILAAVPIHLVDSDSRKAAFLGEAARLTATPATVHNARLEHLAGLNADIVTARACAPLPRLLALARPHLAPGGCCLFLKGRSVEAELTAARQTWIIRAETLPSVSDAGGRIVRIMEFRHRDDA